MGGGLPWERAAIQPAHFPIQERPSKTSTSKSMERSCRRSPTERNPSRPQHFVELRVPGLEHYSFSDEVHLRAAKDGSEQKEEAALRDLRLTEDICRTFLDETLKNENRPILKTDSE